MPPIRSRKYKERVELALLIEACGITMPSCTYCEKHSRRCILSKENSIRCSECIRRGQKCDISGPSAGDMMSIIREQERLDQEREATLSKLLRLDKQQRFLRNRASEMIRRGLKTMDELEEVEGRERLENERVEKEKEMASASVAGPSDDSFAFDSSLDPSILASMDSPSFWANSGISGEMPPTSQGS